MLINIASRIPLFKIQLNRKAEWCEDLCHPSLASASFVRPSFLTDRQTDRQPDTLYTPMKHSSLILLLIDTTQKRFGFCIMCVDSVFSFNRNSFCFRPRISTEIEMRSLQERKKSAIANRINKNEIQY